MTPQEINEAVARRLGWIYNVHPYQYWIPPDLVTRDKHGDRPSGVPAYCTSIAAAWEIVEKLLNEGHGIRLYGRQGFTVNIDGWEETADTAPMAICLAFLKLEDINGSKTKDS